MASKNTTNKHIKESELSGLRGLQAMAKLLKPLHQIGAERDKAGNRNLHMDQYCLLVLMWLYNPIIDSFRGLQPIPLSKSDIPSSQRSSRRLESATARIST